MKISTKYLSMVKIMNLIKTKEFLGLFLKEEKHGKECKSFLKNLKKYLKINTISLDIQMLSLTDIFNYNEVCLNLFNFTFLGRYINISYLPTLFIYSGFINNNYKYIINLTLDDVWRSLNFELYRKKK